MAIIPVPSNRSSDILLRERVLNQMQSDQLSLLRIQDQVSTGRRIQSPSEDAPAAIRALGLQSLLEQKSQSRVNLKATTSFLSATGATLSNASQQITDIRGLAVSMTNTTVSEVERTAAVEEINRAIEQMQNIANRQFRGRYLFSGSTTTTLPYELKDDFVIYHGNDRSLQSFVDVDLLANANVTGQAVFGGISEAVSGTADLNPILTNSTRLDDLRGGAGIREGSILISDGTDSSSINISSAETVGDLIRLIEANPPAGRSLTARIQGGSLVLDLDDAGGGSLTVLDVGGGTTAAELGIANPLGTGVEPLVGQDLNPTLQPSTRLADILGTRASALIDSDHADSDIRIEALLRGEQFNDTRLQFVDDDLLQAAPGLTAGNETARYESSATAAQAGLILAGTNNNLVLTASSPGMDFNNVDIEVVNGGAIGNAATASYDPVARRLTLGIDQSGATQVQTLIDAIDTEGTFTAAHDASDVSDGGFVPTAAVNAADIGIAQGNTGNSGGEAGTLFVHIDPGASKAAQVVEALQNAPDVAALFSASLDGKDSDGDIDVGEGLVNINATAVTSGGSGEELDQNSGLQITNGRVTHTVTFDKAKTVEDLLNALNSSEASVLAEINREGTGINLRSRLSGSDFHVAENGGQTARQLGLNTFGPETLLSDLDYGRGVDTDEGTDFLLRRNDGVELEVDISSAVTIQDVLDAINQHPDNQGSGALEARLRTTGNGIELVDDNPVGTGTLMIVKEGFSNAAWDLNLVARGKGEASAQDGPDPQAATATAVFSPPLNENNRFQLTANQVGTDYNGVTVELVDSGAVSGNTADVSYDPAGKRLTIDIDPSSTTADTLVAAITAEGTFSASLDTAAEPDNDGSGLVSLGTIATTSGGVDHTSATGATASVSFLPPNDSNSALRFEAVDPGTARNGVVIEIRDTLPPGSSPDVTFNSGTNRLLIDIHQPTTSADDVISAVIQEGTFRAERDLTAEPGHNGSGTVGTGEVGITAGGTAEVIAVASANPQETPSVFTSLTRLKYAIKDFDVREIERAVKMLDEDFNKLNFVRAEVGAQERSLDSLLTRLEDEDVELQTQLSQEIDVDIAAAISDFTARQASMEASLRLIGRTLQLSLLNFL